MREEALLAQASVLQDKHEALAAASGQSFNLFAILGRETDEVRTHSAILAELLNPSGSHRQGAVFVRLFAKRFGIDPETVERASVRREEPVADGSRVDILIQTRDTCIVIENKIYADDQPGQLQRYHAYASKRPNSRVFYLTLHGDEPSEDSLGALSLDEVVCISYESHVLDWLDDCVKQVARVPQIREILANYQALLRKLTGTSTGELIMDLKRLLGNKQGERYNFELVPGVAAAMTALSVDAERDFWNRLKEGLQKIEGRPWRLKPVEGIVEGSDSPKEVSEKAIRHAHSRGRNRWYYGCTLTIESDTEPNRYSRDGVEVALRVECDGWGWGFYGLIALEQAANEKRQLRRSAHAGGLFDEWAQRLPKVEDGWHTAGEWWLAWAWPTEDVDLRKTDWLAPDVIRGFLEGEVVDPLVRDICRTIDRLEGCTPSTG